MGWWIAGGILVVLILAGAYFCYKLAFFNDIKDDDIYHVPKSEQYQKQADKMRAAVAEMDAIKDFEEVYITSDDGLRLYGRYYHLKDGAPLQIQMHGYRGNAFRDFCGGHKLARKMGHNTLVIDQRAHGKSEGKVITFGIKERYDCRAWARYAAERFGPDTPIFLVGVSMGAATVLMASDMDLSENVVGVIADCPYSAPGKIIRKVCWDMKIPGWLGYPFVVLGGLIFGHFCIWESSAEKAVMHAKVPVLIIHGEDDRFVPCDMSHQIYNANSETITLETFPEAGHGLSYLLDPPRYEGVIKKFVSRCLAGEEK